MLGVLWDMFHVLRYVWCAVRWFVCCDMFGVQWDIFRVLWHMLRVPWDTFRVLWDMFGVSWDMFRVPWDMPWDVSCAVRYVWCAVRCFVYCDICLGCREICFVCCEICLVCRKICFVCYELRLVWRQICIMCCEICLVCRDKFSVWRFLAAKCHEQKNTLWSTGLRVFEKVPFMYKKGHGSGAGTGCTEITALSQERGKKRTENCMATAFHRARSSLCYWPRAVQYRRQNNLHSRQQRHYAQHLPNLGQFQYYHWDGGGCITVEFLR